MKTLNLPLMTKYPLGGLYDQYFTVWSKVIHFIHPLPIQYVSPFHTPHTCLGAGDVALTKTNKVPILMKFTSSIRVSTQCCPSYLILIAQDGY